MEQTKLTKHPINITCTENIFTMQIIGNKTIPNERVSRNVTPKTSCRNYSSRRVRRDLSRNVHKIQSSKIEICLFDNKEIMELQKIAEQIYDKKRKEREYAENMLDKNRVVKKCNLIKSITKVIKSKK